MSSNDIYEGIKDNFKKARNPFFATLITVWIIRNWKLIYAVFTFDKNYDFNDRVKYLSDYFGGNYSSFWDFWRTFYGDLVICILVSIIVFIISLLFKNWSRWGAEIADAQIRKWTQKIKKTPTLEEYNVLFKEKQDFVLKSEKVSNTNFELEARIDSLKNQISSRDEIIAKKEKDIIDVNKSYNNMMNERDETLNNLRQLRTDFENKVKSNGNLPFPQDSLVGVNLAINGTFNYVINIPIEKEKDVTEMLSDLIDSENSSATYKFKVNKIKKEFKTLTILKFNKVTLDRFIKMLDSKPKMRHEDGKILL